MIKHFKKNSFRLSVLGIVTLSTVCVFSLVNAQGTSVGSTATTTQIIKQTYNAGLKAASAQEIENEIGITPYDVQFISNANQTGATAYMNSFTCSPSNGRALNIYVKNNNSAGTVKFKVYQGSQDFGYVDIDAGQSRARTFIMTDGSGITGDWKVYVTTSDGHSMDINVSAGQIKLLKM
jgi:hypothetical protein